ncbi:MAG: TlpA disulfide reductase family protein [Pyrinomonadaceae bacterium]
MKSLLLLFLLALASFTVRAQDDLTSIYPEIPTALRTGELTDLVGASFKLEDYSGKVLLVNIWGTWCGPCVPDIEQLMKLHNEFNSSGLEIIGFNIGDGDGKPEPKERIDYFRNYRKIDYRLAQAIDPEITVKAFYKLTNHQVVPQTILIGRGGRLRGVFIGGGVRVYKSMKKTVMNALGEK